MWLCFVPCDSNPCLFLQSIHDSRKRKASVLWGAAPPWAYTGLHWNPVFLEPVSWVGRAGLAKLWKQHKDKTHDVFLVAKKSCLLTIRRNSESLILKGRGQCRGEHSHCFLIWILPFPWVGAAYESTIQRCRGTGRICPGVCGFVWLLLLCNKTTSAGFLR